MPPAPNTQTDGWVHSGLEKMYNAPIFEAISKNFHIISIENRTLIMKNSLFSQRAIDWKCKESVHVVFLKIFKISKNRKKNKHFRI